MTREKKVKMAPAATFKSDLIGMLTDDSFKNFPLVPLHHELRDRLRKMRALGVMWGELPYYTPDDGVPTPGA